MDLNSSGKQVETKVLSIDSSNDASSHSSYVDIGDILYPYIDNLKQRIFLFINDEDMNDEKLDIISSKSHQRSCQIHFCNESNLPIYSYWIQYDTNVRKPGHCIYAHNTLKLNTYISHPFIISKSDTLNELNIESVIAVYIPTNENCMVHNITINEELTEITASPYNETIKPSICI